MNLFNLEELSNEKIIEMIKKAIALKNKTLKIPKQSKTIATLFFEPSTRTHYSFMTAAYKLGYEVVDVNVNNSSLLKGETLYDTIKTLEMMELDLMVIRHPQVRYYDELTQIKTPMVSGGDGSGDHPTQVLLDLTTIYEQFGYFKGLKVMIVGDILHSRVANSNYKALTKLGCEVVFSAPQSLKNDFGVYVDFEEEIQNVDICMLLRVQNERHSEKIEEQHTCMSLEHVAKMKDPSIIMHPGPFNRGVEIMDDVVECNKSKIFEQVTNGLYMRMVILDEFIK